MGREQTEPGPRAQDEQSLLLRLRAGDEAAFADLVRENAGRLLAVARRMLRSEDDARDALQAAPEARHERATREIDHAIVRTPLDRGIPLHRRDALALDDDPGVRPGRVLPVEEVG